MPDDNITSIYYVLLLFLFIIIILCFHTQASEDMASN